MKYLLLCVAMTLSSFVFSQSNYEDVVYLKNGSIIHGIIIEQVPGVSLKIKTHSGDVFFYKVEEIEKFTKEEPQIKPKQQPKTIEATEPNPVDPKPYKPFVFDSIVLKTIGTIEIGGIFGMPYTRNYDAYNSSHVQANMFSLKVTIDRMLTRRLSIGGGFGMDISNQDPLSGNNIEASAMIPVYFDIRYSFLKKQVSPYISGQIGGSAYVGYPNNISYSGIFSTSNGLTGGGGALVALQFGMKAYVSRRTALLLSVGYRFQQLAYSGLAQYVDPQGNNTQILNHTYNNYLNFVSLHLGVTF